MAMYAQTAGSHQTTSPVFAGFAGLSITIPEGVGTMAIVTLNVPFPFATGNDNPGGTFGISINGVTSTVIAGFTYNEKDPPASWARPDHACRRRPARTKAAGHPRFVAERARQHRHHRQPRDVVGDPRLRGDRSSSKGQGRH